MIIFAGNFHLVLGQVNFNLRIAWVTVFGLLCFFHYMETGGLRGTTKHVPDYVLPLYLDKCEWLLPSSQFGFHGWKIYTWRSQEREVLELDPWWTRCAATNMPLLLTAF